MLPSMLPASEAFLSVKIHGDPDFENTSPLFVHFEPLEDQDGEAFELLVSARVQSTVRAPGPGPWRLSVDRADWWASPAVWQTDRDHTLDVWPAAPCHGRLQAGREIAAVPSAVTVRVVSPPGEANPSVPETSIECAVEDLRWTCALPVAELDVRVHPKGFVSRYAWGYDVRLGVDNDFGTLVLRRGSAISGRVEAIDRDLEVGEATVRARMVAASLQTQTKNERRRLLELSMAVGARGFFHFQGLEPGSYELTVEHPRYAPTRVGPVPVEADRETDLRYPLTLYPPATLEAWIDPPLAPGGQPWTLKLLRYDAAQPGILEDLGTSVAEASGRLERQGLAEGYYRLKLLDAAGRSVAMEDIELESGMGPIFVSLQIVTVRGLLTLGGEPAAADLRFGGRSAAVAIAVSADEDGVFETWLPRAGSWDIWIESKDLALRRQVRVGVPFPAGRKRESVIEIALPDTRLSGTAVGADGAPLEEVLVTAFVGSDLVFVYTDQQGVFSFRGLRESLVTIQGERHRRGENLVSGQRLVLANEDLPVENIRLVLEPTIELSGAVVGVSGKVAGAKVVARCYDHTGKVAGTIFPSATTGVEGRFTLRLPPNSRSAEVTVMAPGYALAQTRLDSIDAGETVILPVSQHHGTLTLDWGQGLASDQSGSGRDAPTGPDSNTPADPMVLVGGARFFLSTLRQWANVNGVLPHHQGPQTLQVPLMSPGAYRMCWPPSSESGQAITRANHTAAALAQAVQDCVQGSLARGSTLRLALSPPAGGSAGEDLQSSSE